MGFLATWAFWGLAGISLPILAHLLHRFRMKETRWAAMRFLEEALKEQRSKLRVNDLLLLLLRILALVLLVLAFARPFFGQPAATAGGGVATMLLLDVSASMGASSGGLERMEVARDRAREVLDAISPETPVGLLLVSGQVETVVGTPTLERGRIRQAIEAARPNNRGTDLPGALQTAAESLNAFNEGRVVLISDLQTSAFRQPPTLATLEGNYPRITFELLAVGEPNPENLAISEVRLATGATALSGQTTVEIEVRNLGPVPIRSIPVRLALDGQPPSAETTITSLASGASELVTLPVLVEGTGFHIVEASLTGDAFTADNRRALAFEVVEPLPVLLVADPIRPDNRSGLFLLAALDPLGLSSSTATAGASRRPAAGGDAAAAHYLRVQTLSPSALRSEAVTAAPMVVWAARLPPSPLEAGWIAAAVEAGGGAMIWVDAEAASAARSSLGRLVPQLNLASRTTPATLSARPYGHPITARWNDPAAGSLERVALDRWVALEPPATAGVLPVATTSTGEVVALDAPLGEGRVVVVGFRPELTQTALPLHPAFLPLVHRSIQHLQGRREVGLNLRVGEPFSALLPISRLNQPIFLTAPGQSRENAAIVGRTTLEGGAARLRITGPETPGIYEIALGERGEPDFVFSVQFDEAESALASLTADASAGALAVSGSGSPTDPLNDEALRARVRATPGLSADFLWHLCLALGCACFLAEWLMAHLTTVPVRAGANA